MTDARHISIAKRLKRAEGHLRALVGMVENGRDCLEIAQQLHAVEAALTNAKRELIHDHISHCMDDALTKGSMTPNDAIGQMRSLAKYL